MPSSFKLRIGGKPVNREGGAGRGVREGMCSAFIVWRNPTALAELPASEPTLPIALSAVSEKS